MQPLPGGSPGPHANIPRPWRWIIVLAGIVLVIVLGTLIRQSLQLFEPENEKGIEQWSNEWNGLK